jgi:WhiB family redox-sensing transcriptional regulator
MDGCQGAAPLEGGAVWGWRAAAACGRVDSTLFFGLEREPPTARRLRERQAKAIRASCPVAMPCRTHALARRELHGIWGGLSERDRAAIWTTRDLPPATAHGTPA